MARGKKIDIDKIDLEEMQEKVTENPGLISFPHTVGGAIIRPEDEGRIKGRALAAMCDQTDRQFKQIYEQMQTLVNQANALKARVTVSEKIYMSQINFDPVISQVYFLYERNNGETVLSMISPEEWGKPLPYKSFIARVTLLSDHTWDVHEYHA